MNIKMQSTLTQEKNVYIYFQNKITGLFLLQVIPPGTTDIGFHGYDNTLPDMRAIFRATGPGKNVLCRILYLALSLQTKICS